MILERQDFNKLAGFYYGTVLCQLPHGKLKVYIPAVYPAEWKDQPDKLPECTQVVSQFCGSSDGCGVFSYPNIGATVICGFMNGDQNYPFTIGALMGSAEAKRQYEIESEADQDSLNTNEYVQTHRLVAGKTAVTLYDNGSISARMASPVEIPIETLQTRGVYTKDFFYDLSVNFLPLKTAGNVYDAYNRWIAISCVLKEGEKPQDYYDKFSTAVLTSELLGHSFAIGASSKQALAAAVEVAAETNPAIKAAAVAYDTYQDATADNDESTHKQSGKIEWIWITTDGDDHFNLDAQLQLAKKKKYDLVICRCEHLAPSYDKNAVTALLTAKASAYGINILAILPKKTETDLFFNCDGYTSAFVADNYRNLSAAHVMNIDTISSYIEHVISNDFQKTNRQLMPYPKRLELGVCRCEQVTSQEGYTKQLLAYNNQKNHTSCLFDMYIDGHGQYTLTDVKTDEHGAVQEKTECIYDVQLKSGITTIKTEFTNCSSNKKTYSTIVLNKNGEITVNSTKSLDILIQDPSSPSSKSHMRMDQNGKMQIDSTTSLDINSPTVTVKGKTFNSQFTTHSAKASQMSLNSSVMSITGGVGDCKILGKSLVTHLHPVPPHCPVMGITLTPI